MAFGKKLVSHALTRMLDGWEVGCRRDRRKEAPEQGLEHLHVGDNRLLRGLCCQNLLHATPALALQQEVPSLLNN